MRDVKGLLGLRLKYKTGSGKLSITGSVSALGATLLVLTKNKASDWILTTLYELANKIVESPFTAGRKRSPDCFIVCLIKSECTTSRVLLLTFLYFKELPVRFPETFLIAFWKY
jgi:hypothetical protein